MAINLPAAKNALGNIGLLGTAASQATVVPTLQSLNDDKHITLVNNPAEILPTKTTRIFDGTIAARNINFARPTNWTGWSSTQENQIQWTLNYPGWDMGELYLVLPINYNIGAPGNAGTLWGDNDFLLPDNKSWWYAIEFAYVNLLTNLTISIGNNGVNPNSSTSLDITAMKHVAASSPWYEEKDKFDLIGLGLPFGRVIGGQGTTATGSLPYQGLALDRVNMNKLPTWMIETWNRHLTDIIEMLRTDNVINNTTPAASTRTVYMPIPLHRLLPSHTSMERFVLPPGTPIQINLRTVSTAASNQVLLASAGPVGSLSGGPAAFNKRIFAGIAPNSNQPPQIYYETVILNPEAQEAWNNAWKASPLTYPIKWLERNLFNSIQPDPTGRYNLTLTFNQQEPVMLEIAFINNTNTYVKAYPADNNTNSLVGPYSPFPVIISQLVITRTANALIQFNDLDDLYRINAPVNSAQLRSISWPAMYDLFSEKRLSTTNRDSLHQSNLFTCNRLNMVHGTRHQIVVNPSTYNTSHHQGIDPGPTTLNLSFTATNVDGSVINPATQTLIITRQNTAWFSMGPELAVQINNWPRVPSDRLGAQISPVPNPQLPAP